MLLTSLFLTKTTFCPRLSNCQQIDVHAVVDIFLSLSRRQHLVLSNFMFNFVLFYKILNKTNAQPVINVFVITTAFCLKASTSLETSVFEIFCETIKYFNIISIYYVVFFSQKKDDSFLKNVYISNQRLCVLKIEYLTVRCFMILFRTDHSRLFFCK